MLVYIAPLLLILSLALLYYTLIAPSLQRRADGFRDGGKAPATDKLLLDEGDLPRITPTIREALMEHDGGEFLTAQLGFVAKTREIYTDLLQQIATNLAAAAESRDIDAYKQAAIEKIAAENGGVAPKFCDDARINRLLEADATVDGIELAGVCLPPKPTKYLVLLSYAAKLYMQQVKKAEDALGSSGSRASASHQEAAMEMPSFPPTEGFETASMAAIAASASSNMYTSSYKLPPPPSKSTSSAVDAAAATPFDNRLLAWKAAYNAESMKRLTAYMKYIQWARRRIAELNTDLQSGAMIQSIVGPKAPLA